MNRRKTLIFGLLPVFVIAVLGFKQLRPTLEENDIKARDMNACTNLGDFLAKSLDGKPYDLNALVGKKVMIVNIASECGLTPQLGELQKLYDEYGGENFEIIAFPCNDFAGQEPLEGAAISDFCQRNYGVSFPIMEKCHVMGDDQHPIYKWLTDQKENCVGSFEVKWNFHKFLVDETGELVKDVAPQVLPTDAEVVAWIKGE
jgi:glutathione peroxidase